MSIDRESVKSVPIGLFPRRTNAPTCRISVTVTKAMICLNDGVGSLILVPLPLIV